jgi:hypothetical protein
VTESKVSQYLSFIKKFHEGIEEKIEKVKEEKNYHKNICFTVLDLLLMYWDGKELKDPDTEYWNMKAALNKYKNDDIVNLKDYDYCYYSKSGLKGCEIKEKDLLKYLDKLQVIQIDRAKEQKKL